MNKTIIININGTVFHIEEDAYEILKSYMTDVKRHFMHSADSLEITTDIENRVAEMFSDILTRDSKQALVEQDVLAVIEQMGSVQDFEIAEEGDAMKTASSNTAYSNTVPRKLFRDADDRIIAGVCAGIANYFDANPVWIRLAFALSFIAFGTGLWVYIILWIVVPKAITRAERMAMKGEKLNLQGFKRNFEEEMHATQSGLKDFGNQNRPLVYKTRDFAGDFFSHLGTFFRGAGKVLVQILVGCLLASALGGLIALVFVVVAFAVYGNLNIYNLFPFNIVNYQTNTIYLICGFLLMAIPLVVVILVSITALFKRAVFNRSAGFTLLSIWIVTVCVVIYYTAKATVNFREKGSFNKTIRIKPSTAGTYYLKLNEAKYLSKEDSLKLNIKDRFSGMSITDVEEDEFDMRNFNVRLRIEKADIAVPVLELSFSARGGNYEEALSNARNTVYHFEQQDSVLRFPRKLEILNNDSWRNQRVYLTLKVPLNTKLVFEKQLNSFIDNLDLNSCDAEGEYGSNTPAQFIMTADGLQCKVDTLIIPNAAHKGAVNNAISDSAVKNNAISADSIKAKGN
ncbi:MAG: PspC domain-containing protein [Sphingobacteriaceae bacterium]|nr:MAG: PspC domain-containing protein [Sphingobacteriaceae bacterium]